MTQGLQEASSNVVSLRSQYAVTDEPIFRPLLTSGNIHWIPNRNYFLTSCGENVCLVDADRGRIVSSANCKTAIRLSSQDKLLPMPVSQTTFEDQEDFIVAMAASSVPQSNSTTMENVSLDTSNNRIILATTDNDMMLLSVNEVELRFYLHRKWSIGRRSTSISAVEFSPDVYSVVSLCADGSAQIWKLNDFQNHVYLRPQESGRLIQCLFLSFQTTDKRVESTSAKKKPRIKRDSENNSSLEVSSKSNSDWVILGNELGKIFVWDLGQLQCKQVISESRHAILSILYMKSRKCFLVGSRDRLILCFKWNDEAQEFILSAKLALKDNVQSMSLYCIPSRSTVSQLHLAIGSEEGHISIYSLEKWLQGRCNPKSKGCSAEIVIKKKSDELFGESFPFLSPNTRMKTLAFVSASSKVLILDAVSGEIKSNILGQCNSVLDMCLLPRNITCDQGVGDESEEYPVAREKPSNPGIIFLGDTTSAYFMDNGGSHRFTSLAGHTDIVLCVASHQHLGYIATGSKDYTIKIWKQKLRFESLTTVLTASTENCDFVCVAECVGNNAAITGLCFAQNEKSSVVALASISSDNSLKVWLLTSLTKALKKRNMETDSPLIKFTASSDHTIADIHSGSKLSENLSSSSVYCIDFSPQNDKIVTGGRDKKLRIWNWAAGTGLHPQGELQGHKKAIHSVQFSPSNRHMIASASSDGTIKLWNISNGCCSVTLQGHTAAVRRMCFLNHGLQICSVDEEGVCKVWSLQTYASVHTFDTELGKPATLAADRDGEALYIGAECSFLRKWIDVTEQVKKETIVSRRTRVEEKQKLDNCISHGKYVECFRLALKLKHPRTLYRVVTLIAFPARVAEDNKTRHESKAVSSAKSYTCISPEILDAVRDLDKDNLRQLLFFCRDWLLVNKRSTVGHLCLHAVLITHTKERLVSVSWHKNDSDSSNSSSNNLIDALLAYSRKYNARYAASLEDLYFLNLLNNSTHPGQTLAQLLPNTWKGHINS